MSLTKLLQAQIKIVSNPVLNLFEGDWGELAHNQNQEIRSFCDEG